MSFPKPRGYKKQPRPKQKYAESHHHQRQQPQHQQPFEIDTFWPTLGESLSTLKLQSNSKKKDTGQSTAVGAAAATGRTLSGRQDDEVSKVNEVAQINGKSSLKSGKKKKSINNDSNTSTTTNHDGTESAATAKEVYENGDQSEGNNKNICSRTASSSTSSNSASASDSLREQLGSSSSSSAAKRGSEIPKKSKKGKGKWKPMPLDSIIAQSSYKNSSTNSRKYARHSSRRRDNDADTRSEYDNDGEDVYSQNGNDSSWDGRSKGWRKKKGVGGDPDSNASQSSELRSRGRKRNSRRPIYRSGSYDMLSDAHDVHGSMMNAFSYGYSPIESPIEPLLTPPPMAILGLNLFPPGYYDAPLDEATLKTRIKHQIEYYFSEENLLKDIYMRRKMDPNGFLPISFVAGFHRVRLLTQDLKTVIDALNDSEIVELVDDERIRAKKDPQRWPIEDHVPLSLNNGKLSHVNGFNIALKSYKTENGNVNALTPVTSECSNGEDKTEPQNGEAYSNGYIIDSYDGSQYGSDTYSNGYDYAYANGENLINNNSDAPYVFHYGYGQDDGYPYTYYEQQPSLPISANAEQQITPSPQIETHLPHLTTPSTSSASSLSPPSSVHDEKESANQEDYENDCEKVQLDQSKSSSSGPIENDKTPAEDKVLQCEGPVACDPRPKDPEQEILPPSAEPLQTATEESSEATNGATLESPFVMRPDGPIVTGIEDSSRTRAEEPPASSTEHQSETMTNKDHLGPDMGDFESECLTIGDVEQVSNFETESSSETSTNPSSKGSDNPQMGIFLCSVLISILILTISSIRH